MKKALSPLKPTAKHSQIPTRKKSEHKVEQVPLSETEGLKTLTFSISTVLCTDFAEVNIEPVPMFADVSQKELNSVFTQKCKDIQAKKDKRLHLKDFTKFFTNAKNIGLITPQNFTNYYKMVIANICRSFPDIKIISPFDPGDQFIDQCWPHLELIYESLLALFSAPTSIPVDPIIIPVLISCCCSLDDRERLATRDVLKALYTNSPQSRSILLRTLGNQFRVGICSAELLEFFVRAIDGFKTPLSSKRIILFNSLLHLHTSNSLGKFCLSLFHCVSHYITLEKSLLSVAIAYLDQHWPCGSIRKQLLFLSEIEGLVVNFEDDIDEQTAEIIFKRLSDSIQQPNFELAETSINMLMGPSLDSIISRYTYIGANILIPGLYKSASKHWNSIVKDDAVEGIEKMGDFSDEAFKRAVAEMKTAKGKKKSEKARRKTNWAKIVEAARKRDGSIFAIII